MWLQGQTHVFIGAVARAVRPLHALERLVITAISRIDWAMIDV